MWVNVYYPVIGSLGSAYGSRGLADQMAGRGRIACVKVQFDNGEGMKDADEQRDGES
jgi:hypothetical protein